jgi:sugar phosphate isomerase/epimerase
MLELCAAVGASVMAHHPGKVPARPAPQLERLHEVERAALIEMAEVAAGYGVTIAVENLFAEDSGTYTPDPVRLAKEVATINHPHVCGLLDFGHAYIMTRFLGLDYLEAVTTFAPQVNHLHVHDSFGVPRTIGAFFRVAEQTAYGMGDLHLPMGWGDLPWDTVLPELSLRPGTVMIVELGKRHWAELDGCAATARRFMEILNRAEARAA